MAKAVWKGWSDGGDDGKRDKGMEHERGGHGKEYILKRKANILANGTGSEMSLYLFRTQRQDTFIDVQKWIVARLAVYRPIPMFLASQALASLFFRQNKSAIEYECLSRGFFFPFKFKVNPNLIFTRTTHSSRATCSTNTTL